MLLAAVSMGLEGFGGVFWRRKWKERQFLDKPGIPMPPIPRDFD